MAKYHRPTDIFSILCHCMVLLSPTYTQFSQAQFVTMLHKNSGYKQRNHPCHCHLHVSSTPAHKLSCKGNREKPQSTIKLEDDNNVLEFHNDYKHMCMPHIIYADFKVLNTSVVGCTGKESHLTSQKTVSMQLLLNGGLQPWCGHGPSHLL